jgi:SAM-dependent methyltransferase
MDLKYDFVTDGRAGDAHAHQLEAVPPGSRVLELGCATGYVSRLLVEERQARVTGVEMSSEAAERARQWCEDVVVGDLDTLALGPELGSFDVVLAGDVLEHLKDPARVLKQARERLAPGGRVVATIPNVAHGDVRLMLMAGRFDYRRLGLLDETHLRFFTAESIGKLFADAGLAISRLARIRKPLFETELEVEPGLFPPEVLSWVALDPEATTYQFVVVAVPEGQAAPVAPTAEDQQRAAHAAVEAAIAAQREAERQRDELAAALEAEKSRVAELQAALEAEKAREPQFRAELGIKDAAIADVETQLAASQARFTQLETHFTTLEDRFQAMRRASMLNPLVVVPALWRRWRKE